MFRVFGITLEALGASNQSSTTARILQSINLDSGGHLTPSSSTSHPSLQQPDSEINVNQDRLTNAHRTLSRAPVLVTRTAHTDVLHHACTKSKKATLSSPTADPEWAASASNPWGEPGSPGWGDRSNSESAPARCTLVSIRAAELTPQCSRCNQLINLTPGQSTSVRASCSCSTPSAAEDSLPCQSLSPSPTPGERCPMRPLPLHCRACSVPGREPMPVIPVPGLWEVKYVDHLPVPAQTSPLSLDDFTSELFTLACAGGKLSLIKRQETLKLLENRIQTRSILASVKEKDKIN
ncbi:hypothetical protein C8J56DRAFT_1056797 [Mycena floridula]|nr:hypothetical protein C8J56DRAFT_1056797 [Mycena floridula]